MSISRVLQVQVGSMVLLVATAAFGQPLNSAQQKCVNTVNKGMASISKAEWSSVAKCIKSYAKDPTVDVEICLSLASKPLIATAKAVEKAGAACSVAAPEFGLFDELSPAFALGGGEFLAASLLGDLLSAGTAPCDDPVFGDAPCKCQNAILAAAGKNLGLYVSLFNKCKKAGLKDQSIVDLTTLGSCMAEPGKLDPKGKLAKAAEKLAATVGKKCTDEAVSDPFPTGLCGSPSDGAAFTSCVQAQVRCTACFYAVYVDEAVVDCDIFDDGALNDSCVADCPVCP
ncbi:MAG TPA: hypothetical protein VEB21_02265 [Terriglobales bacterium]|nr:hypothetical protein [Terriglobales bacterium]